ncbi:cytochrome c [Salmonella enterica subsp. enterica serovar Choleraesuis]|nr:cytochrome c [Salmonella enterica subsp. enterica serovar Choleraesuis]
MKKRIIGAIVLILVVIIAILWWREQRTASGPLQKVTASAERVAHGRYLVQAADCSACHTAPGGAPLAGGYGLDTPFGKIYGSNLTPSADHGIGRWTRDEFYRALTTGVAPGGRHIYPAMPYTSYKSISRDDADAMYDYLMTRPAVEVSPPANEMSFPFNQRMLMIGWNLLFNSSQPLPATSQGESASWLQGRYLVDVLGHCGECHTPRGIFGQLKTDAGLQGGNLGRIAAPDITPNGLAARGWTSDSLARFLSHGIAAQGSAFDEMHKVIDLSTRHLTADDNRAMVSYLLGDNPPAAKVLPTGKGNASGYQVYLDQCSACHGREGQGKPHVAISMVGNATLSQPDSRNLIVSVLDGLPAQNFPGNEAMQSMPGFADRLDDAQMADLVNYLRATWGGLPETITPAQVQEWRHAKPQ